MIAALFCSNRVKCYTENDGVQTAEIAVANIDEKLSVITPQELKLLSSGHFFAVGVGCYVGAQCQMTSCYLDCVAAFGCEALGAAYSSDILASLDAQVFDIGRQHRGQMASASNLRLLLEGSSRMTTSKNSNQGQAIGSVAGNSALPVDTSIFMQIPQVNGPVLDCVQGVVK